MPSVVILREHTELLDRLLRERASWPEMIKSIRAAFSIGLEEAQDIALSHPGWRRYCDASMNTDPQCRKQALHHVRSRGSASLIVSKDGVLRLLEPQELG